MLDWGLLILRFGLGIIFPFHGWLKLNPQGPLGGVKGFGGWLAQMHVPLPGLFGWIVALLETVGAVLLILGLGTRILAFAIAVDMVAAIGLVKWGKKRFMEPDGTGWEFEFALLMMALTLLLTGAGAIALDRIIGL